MNEKIITLKNIEFSYPKSKHNPRPFKLSLEDFDIAPGEKKAVIAPNGSGKTTLVNIILGVTKLQKGQLSLSPSLMGNEGKRNIAFFSPRINLTTARLSVEENLKYAAAFWDTEKSLVETMLELMKLKEHRRKWFDRLSSGLMNRCIWAMELLKKPELIILDEAFRSVDQETENSLLEVLEGLNKELNSSILFFEPKVHSHLRISSQFYKLEQGRMIEEKRPLEFV